MCGLCTHKVVQKLKFLHTFLQSSPWYLEAFVWLVAGFLLMTTFTIVTFTRPLAMAQDAYYNLKKRNLR